MTPEQHRKIKALGDCRLLAGHPHKRFIRNMATFAEMYPDNDLTERQAYYLEILCWRYRRQMPHDLVPQADPGPLPPKNLQQEVAQAVGFEVEQKLQRAFWDGGASPQ